MVSDYRYLRCMVIVIDYASAQNYSTNSYSGYTISSLVGESWINGDSTGKVRISDSMIGLNILHMIDPPTTSIIGGSPACIKFNFPNSPLYPR
jgi:hypothetical protein